MEGGVKLPATDKNEKPPMTFVRQTRHARDDSIRCKSFINNVFERIVKQSDPDRTFYVAIKAVGLRGALYMTISRITQALLAISISLEDSGRKA